jgi:hypothetical protein
MLSLCLTNYALRNEGVWRSGYIYPLSLTSALVRGEWSASRTACFTAGERDPPVPIGWVHPRRGEEKILDPTGTRTPTLSSSSP